MVDNFSLWVYDGGWQALGIAALILVALGVSLGMVWNTASLRDELSGRKRKKEIEYLRRRFASMQVGTVSDIKIEDPLQARAQEIKNTQTVGIPQTEIGVSNVRPEDVVDVSGIKVSKQQLAAVKNELLADDDAPVTGYMNDASQEVEEPLSVNAEENPVTKEGKPAFKTENVEEIPVSKGENKPTVPAEIPTINNENSVSQPKEGIPTVSYPQTVDNTVDNSPKVDKSSVLANLDRNAEKVAEEAQENNKVENVNPVLPKLDTPIKSVNKTEKPAESSSEKSVNTADEDSVTGVFTPAEDMVNTDSVTTKLSDNSEENSTTGSLSPVEEQPQPATGILTPDMVNASAYHLSGIDFQGEIFSTGSYDLEKGVTNLKKKEQTSDANITGFLNE